MLPPIGPSALARGLEELEEQLVWRVIPAKRAVMMQQVSKTVRTAMERVKPPAMVKEKKTQGMERVDEGTREMTRWARITDIDLAMGSKLRIRGSLRRRWGSAHQLLT